VIYLARQGSVKARGPFIQNNNVVENYL